MTHRVRSINSQFSFEATCDERERESNLLWLEFFPSVFLVFDFWVPHTSGRSFCIFLFPFNALRMYNATNHSLNILENSLPLGIFPIMIIAWFYYLTIFMATIWKLHFFIETSKRYACVRLMEILIILEMQRATVDSLEWLGQLFGTFSSPIKTIATSLLRRKGFNAAINVCSTRLTSLMMFFANNWARSAKSKVF